MSTHRAILRYRAGATDITVYAKQNTNSVSYIGLNLKSIPVIRLTVAEARELQHVLNWCMDQAGGGK